MILPIVAYGDPVLKKETEEIEKDYPFLSVFIYTSHLPENCYHVFKKNLPMAFT